MKTRTAAVKVKVLVIVDTFTFVVKAVAFLDKRAETAAKPIIYS